MIPDKLNQTIPSFSAWLRANWVWAAPLTYIYVTVFGMVQAWIRFNAFDINVFEFSGIEGFLMAAFREPLSFFIALWIIVLELGPAFYRFTIGRKIIEVDKVDSSLKMRRLLLFSFMTLSLITPFFIPVALNKGYDEAWKERFISKPANRVEVLIKGAECHGTVNGWLKELALIGSTDKFFFFYDITNKVVITSPINNIILLKQVNLSNKANAPDSQKLRSKKRPSLLPAGDLQRYAKKNKEQI